MYFLPAFLCWGKIYNVVMAPKKSAANAGQTFVEFILVLLLLVGLAGIFLSISSRGVALRWQTIVGIVTSPNPDQLQKPNFAQD